MASARERQARRRRRAKRLEELQALRAPSNLVGIPDDPIEAYITGIAWPHIEGTGMVRGITPIQRHFLEHCSCFRHDEQGRVRGADIVVKSRRVFLTTLIIGSYLVECARTPMTRAVTVLQNASTKLLLPMFAAVQDVIRNMPEGWLEVRRARDSDYIVTFGNGSSFGLLGAGVKSNVSEQLMRGGTPHLVHLSEAGYYQHYHETLAAVRQAMPRHSVWLVLECSPPPSAHHGFAVEHKLTRQGRGTCHRAFFYAWHEDPNCQYQPGSHEYELVHHPTFVEGMSEEDLAAEKKLSLTPEQIAFRRWQYLTGDPRTREKNRRELPEDPDSCYGSDRDRAISRVTLNEVASMLRQPIAEKQLGENWVGRYWCQDVRYALIVTDSATYEGDDRSSVVALCPYSLDYLGEVVGDATPTMHREAIWWLLERLGCTHQSRHIVVPEVNKDREIGLIDELIPDNRLHIYRRKRNLSIEGKGFGVRIDRHNRSKIMGALMRHLRGDPGLDAADGVQSQLPSEALLDELSTLKTDPKTGSIRAVAPDHDDLVMPLAIGVWISSRLPIPPEHARPRAVVQVPHRGLEQLPRVRRSEKFRPR